MDNRVYEAIEAGDHEKLEELTKNGTNFNDVDMYGELPAHKAARWGYYKCLKILVENGSSLDSTNNNGYTPVQIAAEYALAVDSGYHACSGKLHNYDKCLKILKEQGLFLNEGHWPQYIAELP